MPNSAGRTAPIRTMTAIENEMAVVMTMDLVVGLEVMRTTNIAASDTRPA